MASQKVIYGPSECTTTQIEALSVVHRHFAWPDLTEIRENCRIAHLCERSWQLKAKLERENADKYKKIADEAVQNRDVAKFQLRHAKQILEFGVDCGRLDHKALRMVHQFVAKAHRALDEGVGSDNASEQEP